MKSLKLRISAAVLALVMCFGLLVSCGDKGITLEDVKKDPYTAVMTGSEKYAEALDAKYGDMFAVFEHLVTGVGTYEFKVSVPETADVTLNAVVDAKNGTYSGKAAAGAMGFTTEAKVWGDKNNVALSIPALLGEKNYGVKFDTIEKDLEKSELLSSLLGMSFDDLKASLEEEAGITLDDIKAMFSEESWKAAFDKYVVDSKGYINGKEATVAEESLKIGETETPVITVSYTFTKDDYKKLIELAVEMVESVYGKVLTAAGVDLGELMAEAQTEAGADEFIEGGLALKYYLDKSNGAVIAGDFAAGEIAKIACIYGDPSEKLDMSVTISATVEGESMSAKVAVKEISAEGKSGIEASVSGKVGDEDHSAKLVAERTDADGKYEIKFTADDEVLASANGTLIFNSEEFKVSLDSVSAAGETAELGLSFSATVGGTVEAIPDYVNVATASAAELSDLLMTVGGLIGGFMADDYYEDDYYEDDFSGVFGDYSDIYDDVTDGVADVYDDISGGVADAYDDISDGVADAYDDISDGVADAYDDISGGVADMYNDILSGFEF